LHTRDRDAFYAAHEPSFLRQSYIRALVLSAGRADGMKFRSLLLERARPLDRLPSESRISVSPNGAIARAAISDSPGTGFRRERDKKEITDRPIASRSLFIETSQRVAFHPSRNDVTPNFVAVSNLPRQAPASSAMTMTRHVGAINERGSFHFRYT